MARLVKASCPQCGAGVHVDTNAEVVTCAYCGQSSFVERPNRPVTQAQQAQPGYATIRVDDAPRSSPAAAIFGLLGFVTVVLIVVTGFTFAKKGPSGGGLSLSDEKMHFGDFLGRASVADPKHADVADIIKVARAAIAKKRPTAKLTSASFFDVREGTIDLTGGRGDIHHNGTLNFGYADRDPSKPPGQDVTAGSVMVGIYYDELHAVDTAMPPVAVDVQSGMPDPKCSSRDAWAAVVKSGVPANAVASLNMQGGVTIPNMPNIPNLPKMPELEKLSATTWHFSVEGHLEYDRTVDASTCAIKK